MPPHRLKIISGAIALIVLGVIAWWPKSFLEPITLGIDAYQYHAPVFGSHTQSQIIQSEQPLEAVGALLVPLRRAETLPNAIITFTDTATNTVLQSQTIPGSALKDDSFAYIQLSPPISSTAPIRVTLSAPAASSQNPLGIRFHPDDVYPAGERFFDDRPAAGDLALALQKRLPLWQVLMKIAQYNAAKTTIIVQAGLIAIFVALVASQAGWLKKSPLTRRRIELSLLILLAIATIMSRLPTLNYLGGVSGGDPYNYLFITHSISQLENPFEGTKRLPGYPATLLPAYLTPLNDIAWMRLVNILSAGGIVLAVGLLARRLRLGWSIQFCSAALLAFQKDFYWISIRPEAYTFYAFLLLLSLILFFSLTTWPRRLAFGIVLGYAAMTRQEGFVLAAVLGSSAVIHILAQVYKTRTVAETKKISLSYTLAFLPALALVLPFFINNTLAYGNPLYTPYFEGERLNIVDSWNAFQDAVGATWGILDSLWKTNWDQLERLPLTHPVLLLSSLLGLAWWVYQRWRLSRQTTVESAILVVLSCSIIVASLLAYAQKTNAFTPVFSLVAAGLLLASPLATIGMTRWRGVVLVLVLTTQILIATWFHPFPKHYQQDFSLIMLSVTILLIAPTPSFTGLRRLATGMTFAAVAFTFALVTLHVYEPGRLTTHLDDENRQNALDSIVYRAVTIATTLPGPYGIDQGHLQARLYLQEHAHFYENFENTSPQIETDWLNHNHIRTLVFTNLNPVFTELPPEWELVKKFKAEGKNDQLLESFVYRRR